jgi:ribonuclease inhibitor
LQVIIDGSTVGSELEVHQVLAEAMDFGPYYGHNIAALWDRLSTDIERPIHLIWRDCAKSRASMGEEEFRRIVEVFERTRLQDEAFGWEERFTYSLE